MTRVADPAAELRRERLSVRFATAAALLTAALGASVAIAWLLGVPSLKSVLPGLVSMKFNTALALLTIGGAVWLLLPERAGTARRAAGVAAALTVAALGGSSLFQDLADVDLGIDEFLVLDDAHAVGTGRPGRMAIVAGVGFAWLGIAAAGLAARSQTRSWPFTCAAVAAHVVAASALLGYAFGIESLHRVRPYSSVALHTAAGLALCSAGVVAARPRRGLMRVVVADSLGGHAARRLVVIIPLVLSAVGLLALVGARAGWYDAWFGLAMMTLLGSVLASAVVARQSARLHSLDLDRRRAEAEVRALNVTLEGRVRERTRELEDALARVQTLQGLVPMCAWCQRIRDQQAGREVWISLDEYITGRTAARVSHGICEECLATEQRRIDQGGPGVSRPA